MLNFFPNANDELSKDKPKARVLEDDISNVVNGVNNEEKELLPGTVGYLASFYLDKLYSWSHEDER